MLCLPLSINFYEQLPFLGLGGTELHKIIIVHISVCATVEYMWYDTLWWSLTCLFPAHTYFTHIATSRTLLEVVADEFGNLVDPETRQVISAAGGQSPVPPPPWKCQTPAVEFWNTRQ